MKVLFLDWETTGVPPDDWDMRTGPMGISLGVVATDTDHWNPIAQDQFHVAYTTDHTWSSESERIHGLSRTFLASEGISQADAADRFNDFARTHVGNVIRIGGHNAEFDRKFTKQLLMHSVSSAPVEIDFRIYDSMAIAALLGFSSGGEMFRYYGHQRGVHHDALDDALGALKAFRKVSVELSIYRTFIGAKKANP